MSCAASSKFPERHGMCSRDGQLTATDWGMTGAGGTRIFCLLRAAAFVLPASGLRPLLQLHHTSHDNGRETRVAPAARRGCHACKPQRQGTVHFGRFPRRRCRVLFSLLSLKGSRRFCCFVSFCPRLDDSRPGFFVRLRSATSPPSQMRPDRQVHHGRPSTCLPTTARPPYDA